MKMNSNFANTHNRTKETGSAFVFILLGIAMFASVSYVVTQSMRIGTDSSGNVMGTTERNTVTITDMMQFLDALKIRVFQMTNANNVPESQLDFNNDVYKRANGGVIPGNINPNCLTESCHVFSPYSPQGIVPMLFTSAAVSTGQGAVTLPQNGHGKIYQIDINSVGTAAPDLVFLLHGIKPVICNLYNAKQGLTTTYTDLTDMTAISESSTASVPSDFIGSFNSTNTFGYGATSFAGKKTFCAPGFEDGSDSKLAIWHVLLVR